MSQKIHNYLIERFNLGDDDYFDIDYWDGAAYQTAKIKGSTIKADIQAGMGDMLKSVYDPTNINASPFDYANSVGTQQIHGIHTESITTDVNDFGSGITDFVLKNLIRINTSATNLQITGIQAPPANVNRVILLYNNDASHHFKLLHEDAGSLASNRIRLIGNSTTRQVNAWETVKLWYDHVDNYWKIID